MRNVLRGCLWKSGINGLGVLGFHRLPYRRLFHEAACCHDADYDRKGSWRNRRDYDISFLWHMVIECGTDIQVAFALLYYVLVRVFGWAFYRYNR